LRKTEAYYTQTFGGVFIYYLSKHTILKNPG